MNKKSGVILCFLTILMFWMSASFYLPTFPLYCIQAGASLSMLGIISGGFGFTVLIARLPVGILSDRLVKRKVFVLAGLIIHIAATIVMALFPKPVVLLIMRILDGANISMWACLIVMFVSKFPDNKVALALSMANIANSAGKMFGSFFGGFSADRIGISAPLFISALTAMAAVI